MASGAFFNPKATLLVTPLVSATCSLWYAADQELFFRLFTLPSTRERSDALLPTYFKPFFNIGVWRVIALLGTTTWASVGCIYTAKPLLQSRGSLGWYAGAAALATAHLVYVPFVAPLIEAIVEDRGTAEKTNVDVLGEWLRVNLVRTWTTDLGAWVCAVVAVTKTLAGSIA